jgi:hypothetical protein
MRSRRLILAGHVARIGEKRDVWKGLVRKEEGKRQVGIPIRKWEGNIKIDVREI